jgi:8-oxo-dGTP pyrophosphatase MutT (NUDIX family)
MEKVTLCLCIDQESVLLAEKKAGFGGGKINGFGGKIKLGEKPKEAAVRELAEESGLTGKVEDLKQVALLYFYFQNVLRYTCQVYTLHKWQGKPKETTEMKEAEMYEFNKLPLGTDRMWKGDQKWLPRVLHGETITANVYYNKDRSQLDDFSFEHTTFNG